RPVVVHRQQRNPAVVRPRPAHAQLVILIGRDRYPGGLADVDEGYRRVVDGVLRLPVGVGADDIEPRVRLQPGGYRTGEAHLDRQRVGGAAAEHHAGEVRRAARPQRDEAGDADPPATEGHSVVVHRAGGVVEDGQPYRVAGR